MVQPLLLTTAEPERRSDLALRCRALRAALDRLGIGVVVLDEAGRVVEANRAIVAIAAREAGRDARRRGSDEVRTGGPIRDLARRALASRVWNEIMPIERMTGPPLHALAVPLDPGSAAPVGWRLLLVADPGARREPAAACLQRVYGLTPAEARVAELIARGRSLRAIAESLDVRIHTVRNQLKQVFEKTQTHRQAELVHLLQSGPVALQAFGDGRDAPPGSARAADG